VFIRYRRDKKGKLVEQALIYTEKEHGISRAMIEPDAVRIIERLKNAGHQAFIVGGAVRDLLQGATPKDFDLVTDAVPTKIKKLFRNARIIGKRFRLVHIMAGGTIYEVSTFRSNKFGSIGNEFGTMDEDVQRRDFTFNALYLDPTDGTLVDFVGGFKDIKAKRIKPIIPLDRIFVEDPVRIVRGVKYGATAGFSVPFLLGRAIKRDSKLLAEVSSSRMTEEFFKILASGKAEPILRCLCKYRLLEYFVPQVWARIQSDLSYSKALFADLKELDALKVDVSDADLQEAEDPSTEGNTGKQKLSVVLSYFIKSWIQQESDEAADYSETFRQALASARSFIQPMNPPRVELEAAVFMIVRASGQSPLQKPHKTRRRRRSPGKKPGSAAPNGAESPSGEETPETLEGRMASGNT